MQLLTGTTQQGTITCDTCNSPLFGKDAILYHCDRCALETLLEPLPAFNGCKDYPDCGCQTKWECSNYTNP